MRKRALAIIVVAVLAAFGAGVALATPPSGLFSELLARGAAGTFRIQDKSMKLSIQAKKATDVAVVRATIEPGGYTGWHGHPGPSLVIVKSGTLTMYQPSRRHGEDDDDEGQGRERCVEQTFGPGQVFVHPEDVHNFVNAGSEKLEFFVVYFVPEAAAPLLRDEPVPPGCS
jgi:quercetin dioxygenase-like cupin family protein